MSPDPEDHGYAIKTPELAVNAVLNVLAEYFLEARKHGVKVFVLGAARAIYRMQTTSAEGLRREDFQGKLVRLCQEENVFESSSANQSPDTCYHTGEVNQACRLFRTARKLSAHGRVITDPRRFTESMYAAMVRVSTSELMKAAEAELASDDVEP